MKSKLFYLPLGILTVMSSASGLVLAGGSVQAASGSAGLKVTVTNACNFINTSNGSSSKTGVAGQTTSYTSLNTLEAVCNYSSGMKLYVVGYTNDVYGRTYMNGGSSGNIATGTGNSGTASAWAMSLSIPSDTTYTPTITNGYRYASTQWAAIPSTSTVVATYSGVTPQTAGMKVTTNYRVYVGTSQAAGTYTGKVKYTVLNAGASAPTS